MRNWKEWWGETNFLHYLGMFLVVSATMIAFFKEGFWWWNSNIAGAALWFFLGEITRLEEKVRQLNKEKNDGKN